MIEASIIADQPGRCILDSLELVHQVVSQAIQEAVEIIQMTRYKHIDQNMSTVKTEKVANSPYVIQVKKSGFTNVINVCPPLTVDQTRYEGSLLR